MSDKWKLALKNLVDFIDKHPEIEISENVIGIPAEFKPDFYKLFNLVRTTIIEEKMAAFIEHAKPLSRSFMKIEDEVLNKLALNQITMDPGLSRFLHDPMDQLTRGLFYLLFDLLKGRLDNDKFERKAIDNVGLPFLHLYRLGYTKWIAISLIRLLEADNLFKAVSRESGSSEGQGSKENGLSYEVITTVDESRNIVFHHDQKVILLVPDVIFRSSINGKYISVMSYYSPASGRASDTSKKRKWYPLDSVASLDTDLILIYIDDKPEELALVADVDRICKPDMIVHSRERKGWFKAEGMQRIMPQHISLKPNLGSYIVSKEPSPEVKLDEREEGINVIYAGLDITRLQPIADTIINRK
ncbi:hypothetical protein ACFLYS_02715 [Chloroflexota bacterium]